MDKVKKILLGKLSEYLGIKIDALRGHIEEWKRKGIVDTYTEIYYKIYPDEKILNGLPEERMLDILLELKSIKLEELFKKSSLNKQDFNAGLAILVKKGVAKIEKRGEDTFLTIDTQGEKAARNYLEVIRRLRSKLNKEKGLIEEELDEEERELVDELRKRPGVIKAKQIKNEYIILHKPLDEIKKEIEEDYLKELTREILIRGLWKNRRIKSIDPNEPTHRIYPGRIHPLTETIKEVREVFLLMGFEEYDGPLIETAFTNFDMLYQPQDHPARDMHDTLYLERPITHGPIPYPEFVDKIAKVHEDGANTGSTGWGYRWDMNEAKKLLMRTHMTAVTIRGLYENRHRDELKLFSIGRVFRNETIDYKHLSDFTQVDGILMHKNASLRLLMGILEMFFKKLGAKKIRFWPTYFPFTEPSIQPTVYMEEIGEWIELGGAGIFRPEITLPMGVDNPVLAWGLGLERIIMIKYGIRDIREIYSNRLEWLRRRRL